MGRIGYARVSALDQDIAIQVAALKAAECSIIREEKASGSSTAGRPVLQLILDLLRPDDVLVVTRIDRLARSIADLQTIVRTIRDKGASLACTEQPVDTGTAAGKAFLDMLGVFAEFETNLRKERQREGIAKAKAEGRYTGRKPTVDAGMVRAMKAAGHSWKEIAVKLAISKATVFRLLKVA